MTANLLYNEVRLYVIETRQYWFELVTGLLFITAVFIGLFYGVKGFVVEQGDSSSLDGLLFGYIMWNFATQAYGSITHSVVEDTQKGYIEQLFLCPHGFVTIMLTRALVGAVVGLLIVTAMAYIAMLFTGNWLELNFALFYGILLLAAPSLVGFGLMISGLALIFKRVETVGAMLSLGLMGLVALDGLPLNLFSFLPFVAGGSLARDLVLNQQAFVPLHFLIVLVNSAVYLGLGIAAFRYCEKQAKKRNLIGQY